MSKQVNFDGQIHEFPDDFTDDEISQALSGKPELSAGDVGADVLKSYGTGVGRGSVGLATAPFDIGAALGGYLGKKAVGDSTLGITPDSTIGRGLEAVFGNGGLAEGLPSSLTEAATKGVGLTYQPQTTAGKYAETAGEFLPVAAAFPSKSASTLAEKAMQALKTSTLSGIGSEAAGQATQGTEYEPLARIAGGLGGYGAGNYAIGGLKNLGRGVVASSPEAINTTKQSLFDVGAKTSEQMRKIGAAPTPEAAQNLVSSVVDSVGSSGSKIDDVLTPQTKKILEIMDQDAKSGKLDVSSIDKYATLLNNVSGTNFDTVAAGSAKRALLKSLNDMSPMDLTNGGREAISLLNQKKAEFSKAFRFEEVGDILEKAAGDQNKIKAGLTKFLRDNDYAQGLAKRGWKPNEIKAAKEAARTGVGEWLNKAIGVLGVDITKPSVGNFLIPALEGGAAMAIPGGGQAALPLVAGGTAARFANTLLARGKAQNLLNTIKNNPIGVSR